MMTATASLTSDYAIEFKPEPGDSSPWIVRFVDDADGCIDSFRTRRQAEAWVRQATVEGLQETLADAISRCKDLAKLEQIRAILGA